MRAMVPRYHVLPDPLYRASILAPTPPRASSFASSWFGDQLGGHRLLPRSHFTGHLLLRVLRVLPVLPMLLLLLLLLLV